MRGQARSRLLNADLLGSLAEDNRVVKLLSPEGVKVIEPHRLVPPRSLASRLGHLVLCTLQVVRFKVHERAIFDAFVLGSRRGGVIAARIEEVEQLGDVFGRNVASEGPGRVDICRRNMSEVLPYMRPTSLITHIR